MNVFQMRRPQAVGPVPSARPIVASSMKPPSVITPQPTPQPFTTPSRQEGTDPYDPYVLPTIESIDTSQPGAIDSYLNSVGVATIQNVLISSFTPSVVGLNQQQLASVLIRNFDLTLRPLNYGLDERPIELHEHQLKHMKVVTDHLNRSSIKSYLDTSVTGTGKTYFLTALARSLGMPLAVICPNSTLDVWEDITTAYNIPYYFITSFESLSKNGRSKRIETFGNKNYEYPLFNVREVKTSPKVSHNEYEPLSFLFRMIANGPVALIVDEAHRIKNKSNFSRAVVSLIHFLHHYSPESHIFLATASPFNRAENSVNLMEALCLFDEEFTTYDASSKTVVATRGFTQLVNTCRAIDPNATNIVLSKSPQRQTKDFITTAFNLYRFVVKKEFVYAMPLPKIDQPYDIKEGYYRIDDIKDLQLLKAAQEIGIRIAKAKEEGIKQKNVVAGIANIISYYEMGLTNLMCELVHDDYYNYPTCKIVVLVQRVEQPATIDKMVQWLGERGIRAGVISGRMSGEKGRRERRAVREEFQRPEMNTLRVIILTMDTGAASISLHDIHGGRPRRMYVDPRFGAISMLQASGRIFRVGVKSECYARLVQSVEYPLTRVLNSLAVSSLIIGESQADSDEGDEEDGMDDSYKGQIKLPGEYDWEIYFFDTDSEADRLWWTNNILSIKAKAKENKEKYMREKQEIINDIKGSPRYA